MSDFDPLKHCLGAWPRQSPPDAPLEDHACERLRSVLHRIWHDGKYPGTGDLAGLIQHVIRRQRVLLPGASPWAVPLRSEWPDAELWRLSGLNVVSENSQFVTIEDRRAWSTEWLLDSDRVAPLEAALRETQRRYRQTDDLLRLDPALSIECGLPYETYSCSGQQQAIHATMLMQPEATLAVNLPTGSGKSLVAWSAAMLAESGILTVVVLPTVALALDQERQMVEQFRNLPGGLPDRLAWHGSLSADEKKSIRQRLREGTQRVLFASPEAVTGSLCRELFKTAEDGRFKYFVIDEAHLVSQWGTEFRPEFQAMAGLRRELIECCAQHEHRLRTLLLSATLTEESIEVLRDLFSDAIFEVISAVHLRPEPEYWISHAASETQKEERVLELVRVLPRPFLMYVTERKDAIAWTRNLNAAGYTRLGCVHGGTSGEERLRVIDEWRAGKLDGVVATSAFGLGMDKGDVRAVIHACAPETVDRLYQEVGRGGRDGKACVSFLVYTDRDLKIAKGLSTNCFISVDRGLERWQWMMDNAAPTDREGVYRVNLNTLPPDKSKDNAANRAWNLRTLLLLNRAKIIQLESERPPDIQRSEGETDEQLGSRRQEATQDYLDSAFIRILENSHRDTATWQRLVEPSRKASYERDFRNFSDVCDVLDGKREIADVLAQAYSVHRDGVHVSPVKVCGGCAKCRTSDDMNRECRPPKCGPGHMPDASIDVRLLELMRHSESNVLFVSCPKSLREIKTKLQREILPTFVKWGISEVALPDDWLSRRSCQELYRRSPHRFLIHRSVDDMDSRRDQIEVPRVTVFFPEDDDTPFPRELLQIERPMHIIFCSSRVRDPWRPREPFFDRATHVSYANVSGSLQS
ncbi:MAG: protein DpdF [Planctomycetota bacterium]|nr:protein DpdF [Planctomycetota bacterium]